MKFVELENKIKNKIRKDIEQASGQEIFLLANIDSKSEQITDYNLLARGNKYMAPAILSDLRPGQVIIHNHPSGDLTPSANDIHIASRVGEKGTGFAIIDNNVANIYIVVEPRLPDEEVKLNRKELISLFRPEGKLAEVMSDYEYREEQIKVLKEVIYTFNNHHNSLIEAGTGTGKSLAYLIPALYWARNNGQTVVISTNTINLQEQLIKKDLLLLEKILPFTFKAVLVKGRRNYVCQRKVNNLKRADDFDINEKEIAEIFDWIDNTHTGTKSEINFLIAPEFWERIVSESDLCLNTKCPYFDSCFFMEARKEVFSADILIVNHHLLLSDACLKTENNSVLPDYKNLIIDEAHNFTDVATYHLGNPFYSKLLHKFFEKLTDTSYSIIPALRNNINKLNIDDLKTLNNIVDKKILQKVKDIKEINTEYFHILKKYFPRNNKNKLRLTAERINEQEWKNIISTGEKLAGYLKNLAINLNNLYKKLINQNEKIIKNIEEQLIELENIFNNLNQLITALEFNLYSEDDSYVYWLEEERENISQKNAPLEIATILQDILWDNISNLVLTSATLTVNNDFHFYKNSLGLKNAEELVVKSPFDYAQQAKLLVPEDIPAANSPKFFREITEILKKMLLTYGGSTLVLFTSYKMLNYCLEKIETKLNQHGLNVLAQSKHPRHYILKAFKNNSAQIIFGTLSFWEGVDIKGDDLKYLIIMKLPFPVPTEPIAAARREKLKNEGKNDFYYYSLPHAVIRFRQGFGRLIRSRSDQGTVFVADNRIIKKSYGSYFLKSVPDGCPVITDKIDNLISGGNNNEK